MKKLTEDWYALSGVLKMFSGCVFIRSGKTCRHGKCCHERSVYTHRFLEVGDMTCHVDHTEKY